MIGSVNSAIVLQLFVIKQTFHASSLLAKLDVEGHRGYMDVILTKYPGLSVYCSCIYKSGACKGRYTSRKAIGTSMDQGCSRTRVCASILDRTNMT